MVRVRVWVRTSSHINRETNVCECVCSPGLQIIAPSLPLQLWSQPIFLASPSKAELGRWGQRMLRSVRSAIGKAFRFLMCFKWAVHTQWKKMHVLIFNYGVNGFTSPTMQCLMKLWGHKIMEIEKKKDSKQNCIKSVFSQIRRRGKKKPELFSNKPLGHTYGFASKRCMKVYGFWEIQLSAKLC